MLAYSSLEQMGLAAVAAADSTELAIAALLLHVLAHGLGSLLFIGAGQLQLTHHSTAIADVTGLSQQSALGRLPRRWLRRDPRLPAVRALRK